MSSGRSDFRSDWWTSKCAQLTRSGPASSSSGERRSGVRFPADPAVRQEPLPTSAVSPHILVADDQADVREALRLLLKGEGYVIETVASPAAVISAVQSADFDAVLLDLNYARDTTTGREGLELVSQLQGFD